MIDYSNVVEPLPCRARGDRRLGRFLLVLVILAASFCWHVSGSTDRAGKPAAPVEFTAAQIDTMRANGRLLSQRGLAP